MSKSCRAERNHSSLKQRCMNGSLVEPEFMTVTAASLSHEMMNRWCCKTGAQNLTATTIVKSSNAEMWVATEITGSGKANVMHWSRHVAPPRTMQASVLKRKLAKDHSSGFITETPFGLNCRGVSTPLPYNIIISATLVQSSFAGKFLWPSISGPFLANPIRSPDVISHSWLLLISPFHI